MLPVDYLRAKYLELSSVFINEVNNNTIELYFAAQENFTVSLGDNNEEDYSRYGGMQRQDDFKNRQNESGSDLVESPKSVSIVARVYWKNKPFNRDNAQIGVNNPDTICRIITYSDHLPLLKATDYAIINSIQCKMIGEPTVYGLFGKQWAAADFKQMSGV